MLKLNHVHDNGATWVRINFIAKIQFSKTEHSKVTLQSGEEITCFDPPDRLVSTILAYEEVTKGV